MQRCAKEMDDTIMTKGFEDMQKLGQSNVDNAMRMFGEFWQAIAAEMGDYTKRSFEEGSATLENRRLAESQRIAPEHLQGQEEATGR